MAEGGNLKSIKDGSDADFDLTCTPCGKDNIREEAEKYCPECQEYLCRTCVRYHGRLKASQGHKLLEKNDARHGLNVTKTKCIYHADRDIEMYCNTHDMVYCTMCIATDHRSCNGVNKIEDVSKENASRTDIQSLLEETKKAEEQVKSLTVKQKQNLTVVDEQRKAIQVKLGDTETSLIELIRKLKIKASENLNNKYASLKETIASSISESSSTSEALKQTKEQLKYVHNLDKDQQFVKMKLMRKTVNDANRFNTEKESNDTKTIEFKENRELTNLIAKVDSLGLVTCERKREQKPKHKRQYKMKIKKEINVKVKDDKSTCLISDIFKLPDGTILLTDWNNNKVKRLDSSESVKDVCNLDAKPTGICCIGSNEIAVKMNNNKIQFLIVDQTVLKLRAIDITNGRVFGLTSCCDVLWSSSSTGINMYNTSSGLVKSIDEDQNGKPIFKSGVQHMAVSTDTVIVTDNTDGAVCLNKDGNVLRELKDGRLEKTRGVCVADDGTVFLCGYNSNNIVMFSKDGKCEEELVGTDPGLKSPINMCYDGERHRILVTCDESNYLNIIELFD